MDEIEYGKAAAEVLDILNYTNQEEINKIPQSFIRFLTDNANKDYKVNFNHAYPMSRLNLKKQTKEILGFIYITWWCDEKDKNRYKDKIHSDNFKLDKCKIDDIFRYRNKKMYN